MSWFVMTEIAVAVSLSLCGRFDTEVTSILESSSRLMVFRESTLLPSAAKTAPPAPRVAAANAVNRRQLSGAVTPRKCFTIMYAIAKLQK
jgi:hypothetical protein